MTNTKALFTTISTLTQFGEVHGFYWREKESIFLNAKMPKDTLSPTINMYDRIFIELIEEPLKMKDVGYIVVYDENIDQIVFAEYGKKNNDIVMVFRPEGYDEEICFSLNKYKNFQIVGRIHSVHKEP